MDKKGTKKRYRDDLDSQTGERYDQKLSLIGGCDPYELEKHQLTSDPKSLPAVHYIDVINYLMNTKSAYSLEQLKACKSLEAYNQTYYGWVKDVQNMTVGDNVLVMAKVKHSQRLNETPLKPWVIANKNGTIEAAHCNCMAGLGESCSHVGAVLFYLEAHWRYMSRRTVTQDKAYWPLPPGIDKVPYAEVREIDFTSASTKKRRIDSVINGEDNEITRSVTRLPKVTEPSTHEKEDLLQKLYMAGSNASVLTVSAKYQKSYLPKILQDGQLPQPLVNLRDEKYLNMTGDELRDECKSVFETIKVTCEQAKNVEFISRKQAKSKEWHRLRMGRITASNMKAVCSTTTDKPAISTVNSICGQSNFKSKPCEYGCAHEKVALQDYLNVMRLKHENFTLTESGLWIDPRYPYIGATPDGLVSCNCCGEGVVEIKCPYCAKDKLLAEADIECLKEGKLKESHKYFYQVQTQMLVTGRDYCDFVLWAKNDINIERIETNEEIEVEILDKSEKFFKLVLLPELTGSLISREDAERKCAKSCTDHRPCPEIRPMPAANKNSTRQPKYPEEKMKVLECSSSENHASQSKAMQSSASETLCVCKSMCDAKSDKVVKCDSENCQYGLLHFKCVNLKRKPKSPYYCPECRKSMWK